MADKKKKLSGFQNRKRKVEDEKSLTKIKGSLLKYLSNRNDQTEVKATTSEQLYLSTINSEDLSKS